VFFHLVLKEQKEQKEQKRAKKLYVIGDGAIGDSSADLRLFHPQHKHERKSFAD
jgi:hypothetical protein